MNFPRGDLLTCSAERRTWFKYLLFVMLACYIWILAESSYMFCFLSMKCFSLTLVACIPLQLFTKLDLFNRKEKEKRTSYKNSANTIYLCLLLLHIHPWTINLDYFWSLIEFGFRVSNCNVFDWLYGGITNKIMLY